MRLAPVDVNHRHVVVEEELVLVVTNHDDDVRLGLREALLELVQAGLDDFDALVEDFAVHHRCDRRVCVSQQLVVADALAFGHLDETVVSGVVLSL